MTILAILVCVLSWIAVGKIAVTQTMVFSSEVSRWKKLLIQLTWPRYWKYRYERYPRDDDEI
ncbi:hypothetical protein LCGC14_0534110 [marine sediment metagenome]|uniref:Uncharacterized protein n=1 Tax=marine sediment metagenome TaxID=412755 RepID=A0A0F9SD16_9ZZZZ